MPDEKIEDVIISQYTYIVYAGYDVILSIRDKRDLEKLITYNDKKILLFVKNMLYNKNIINNTEIIAIAFLFFNIKIPPF